MQIVSIGDNFHTMSKPVFWEKQNKYFKMSSAEILTQHAEHEEIIITYKKEKYCTQLS